MKLSKILPLFLICTLFCGLNAKAAKDESAGQKFVLQIGDKSYETNNIYYSLIPSVDKKDTLPVIELSVGLTVKPDAQLLKWLGDPTMAMDGKITVTSKKDAKLLQEISFKNAYIINSSVDVTSNNVSTAFTVQCMELTDHGVTMKGSNKPDNGSSSNMGD